MANEIGAILNSPWFDRGLAVVLVFYLLRGMHQDIAKLTSAIIALDANVRTGTSHQTARMTEIRNHQGEIRALLGGIQALLTRLFAGGNHGTKDDVH